MTDAHDEQLERFGEAVEEKKRVAEERSRSGGEQRGVPPGEIEGDQADLYEHGRPQDTLSARDKSSGKGKKTADKWNQ